MYIGQLSDNRAVVFGDELCAKQSEMPYTTFDEIPEGTGLLKTDLVTLWWEAAPAPTPEPVPVVILSNEELTKENKQLKTKLQATAETQAFQEECLIEMAAIVYA